jgi:two-component system, NtrC family, nitrogen regulation response regulator NtrX
MKRERVLVVDDDQVLLQIVRAWLESDGYEVTTMDTPFGATAAVLRERPQVVLLDVAMPALDGQSLAEAMRRGRAADTSIIFYSGRRRAELAELAERHGALGFIVKTADGNEFLGQFRSLLDRRRAP